MTPAQQMVRSKEYETIYILRPDIDGETAERVQARVAEVIGRDNGKLVKVEQWGRRKLAYPVAKQKKGVYVYVKYVGRGALVGELERNLKIADSVIKFQTVITNEAVDSAQVVVDPEEVKFQKLELEPDTEEQESRERALGLIDAGPEERKSRGDEDDFYGDGGNAGGGAGRGDAASADGDDAPVASQAEPKKEDAAN